MIDIAKLIPNELIEMAKLFPKQAPLYIVGGFVRDAIEYNTAIAIQSHAPTCGETLFPLDKVSVLLVISLLFLV